MSPLQITYVNTAILDLSILLDAALLLGMSGGSTMHKRRLLLTAMWLHLVAMIGDLVARQLSGHAGTTNRMLLEVGSYLSYILSIVTCVTILVYICTDSSNELIRELRTSALIGTILLANAANLAMSMANPWTHAYYYVGPDNVFCWGPLICLHDMLYAIQALLLLPVIVRLRYRHTPATAARLLASGLVAVVSVGLTLRYRQIAFMPASVSLVMAILCVGVQARLERDLAQARTEVAESRVRLLSGQIHPHFIFNSLNAIKALIVEDPALAEQAVQDFSDYLRAHLDEMSSSRLVSFEQEMGHVRHYVSLEMADSSRPLQVSYSLEVEDFMVPPLTVQPLVENAIRHGIGTRAEGGTVCVETRETDKAILVSVVDDGHGISSATSRQKERSQVGLDNVRERLERQCGGTLEVRATDDGTKATMMLPKGGMR